MDKFISYIISPAFYGSVITIVLMIAVLNYIKQYLIKKVAYTNKDEQHRNTLIGVLFNVLQYIVIIVSIAIVLKLNGVNITSILAGLGIMATIIGLSLQDTLKDIISGISIYSNNFYKVGDVVKYQGRLCEVKYFNAKVTKFRDLLNNSTFTVSNSTITAIEKIKGENVEFFYFKPSEDPEKINKVFKKIVKRVEDVHGINSTFATKVCYDQEGLRVIVGYSGNPRKYYDFQGEVKNIAFEEIYKNKLKYNFKNPIVIENNKNK